MKKFLNSFAFLVCLFLIFSLECNAKEYITDIKSLDAGTVIEENKIDSTNLDLYFTSVKIKKDDNIYKRIYGKTYVENKDISLDDLRYLKMLHYNFDGKIVVGEMIVNKNIESNTLNVFKTFFCSHYQIRQMHLPDDFWNKDSLTTDDTCMLIDNTSCFNYRVIQGTKKLSKHSLGLAIDINPHENPYAKVNKNGSLTIFKKELYEKNCLQKRDSKAHAITKNDLAYKAFKNNGFKWGGNWKTVKDFQHFEQR